MIWLTVLISWAKKIPWQLWLLAGVLFSFWLYGNWQFHRGQADIQEDWNASIERGKVLVAELEAKAPIINTVIEERVVTKTKVIREKADTIIKEIPVYILATTPDLPGGFRLLHDAAARSELPDRTRLIDAAPVRVEDATTTVVANYAECNLYRVQVLEWQEWYRRQSLAWKTAQRR